MGKLSSYEYPDYSLYDSLELAELINDTYSGSVSRSVLSDALNMSTFGGAFASKLAAARLWGLIVGRGNIQLSYHAKNLINLHQRWSRHYEYTLDFRDQQRQKKIYIYLLFRHTTNTHMDK